MNCYNVRLQRRLAQKTAQMPVAPRMRPRSLPLSGKRIIRTSLRIVPFQASNLRDRPVGNKKAGANNWTACHEV
jgi:hypothetical protein